MAFYFGEDTDTLVATLFEEMSKTSGVDLTSEHPDEMSLQFLARVLIVSRLTYKEAMLKKMSTEVLQEILDYHDYIFQKYCEADPKFVKRMRNGRHEYLGHMSQANQRKYWKLAGLVK